MSILSGIVAVILLLSAIAVIALTMSVEHEGKGSIMGETWGSGSSQKNRGKTDTVEGKVRNCIIALASVMAVLLIIAPHLG